MSFTAIYYQPDPDISDFVSCYWTVENAVNGSVVTVVPDAYFELILSKEEGREFEVSLVGLGTRFEADIEMPVTRMFGISFTLMASEYIFGHPIADLVDSAQGLPKDFWGFCEDDLDDTVRLIEKATQKIRHLIPAVTDTRKRQLFKLVYESNGSVTVSEISLKTGWSSRQINRYFNRQFGVSLKSYCNFLRFRSSYRQLKEGRLYPEQNFSDQAHFIREVRKLSGVSPKELSKNENDRFIQFSGRHLK
ncbi:MULTISPECIES: helix-turn-helix domain-containing protein [Chryseobacterium]|uniref:AraC-like DNA-binding protein n=1 Tax=Chryseobacterium camelliae TaxID=1265445 RepID=A0ABU0TFM8_9FLAO|nr:MULTISPECIES: AraC family transcriptional regulator [Chryseobacterium]MDT3406339.1 AraC-like DNA-binding protein [Pseudacidovorax intermedius]MDQ1095862.1 AraC-like DNA-binding protein [Chryseobacterium camelliae]MDQ1099798.1 AraC-like DNA-binding protein [Chryseobacterium sp. SORGH_AS_1048]MDR6087145.1 AraC-like DNA-binding protein [Chryseobacterium sp. SORGH_AS_0909]MDR6131518.1 AraC-like DNA-binding protein [Chryseobacterium sp. SORGH_AS_1175]